jgi:hypothetical protein
LLRTDVDGVTRQYVQLNSAADSNLTVEVSGKGKTNAANGKLLENPDEIIEDIGRVAGKALSFPLFREACNQRGLRIAGSVYEARSVRSYVKEIIDSCGAMWLGENAIFYPEVIDYARPIDFPSDISHELTLDDVAGAMGVFYGWNQARERNGGYIELSAVGCQYTNKGEYIAKWLRQARDAEELARRLLSKRAGLFIKTTATVPGIVRAGERVDMASKSYPGKMTVLTASNDGVQSVITGERIIEPYTSLRLVRYSAEILSRRGESVEITFNGSLATLIILDVQGRPLVGLFASLDAGTAKRTDSNGSVSFITTPGEHALSLTGPDIDPEPFSIFIK